MNRELESLLKMNREIEYRNCTISQASNNHLVICKNGERVFHANIDKRLSDDELKKNCVEEIV